MIIIHIKISDNTATDAVYQINALTSAALGVDLLEMGNSTRTTNCRHLTFFKSKSTVFFKTHICHHLLHLVRRTTSLISSVLLSHHVRRCACPQPPWHWLTSVHLAFEGQRWVGVGADSAHRGTLAVCHTFVCHFVSSCCS